MTPSNRQIPIYNEWEFTDNNILVSSVAGSGKTTTLIEILKLCKYKTLFLAFNKSIQTEITNIIEQENLTVGKAMTMHSLGLSAIKNNVKFRINNNKKWDVLTKIQNQHDNLYSNIPWEEKLKINYTILDMIDVTKIFLTDDMNTVINHMIDMDKNYNDIDVPDEINGTTNSFIKLIWDDVLAIRDWYYEQPVVEIDFNDMIYLPVIKEFAIPVNPYYLMIDEAQDLNILQHKLVDQLLDQGDINKFIAVGDPNQSIYGFAGAYAESFELFKKKPNTIELPLDICYRCPTSIIEEANKVYDIMEGNKTHPGIVETIDNFELIKDNSMIICRNSGPLFDVYFKLLGLKKKVVIKGEDIIGSIVNFMKPMQYKTVSQARIKIERDIYKLSQQLDDERNRFKHHKMKDNLELFNVLTHNMCVDSTKLIDLIKEVYQIFKNDDEEAIILCTIHKSKGLQADIVYILNEGLIPSKFAKSEKQLKQEINLKYVARTRAKEELYYLNL